MGIKRITRPYRLLSRAETNYYMGTPCPDFDPGCPACQFYARHRVRRDRLSAIRSEINAHMVAIKRLRLEKFELHCEEQSVRNEMERDILTSQQLGMFK